MFTIDNAEVRTKVADLIGDITSVTWTDDEKLMECFFLPVVGGRDQFRESTIVAGEIEARRTDTETGIRFHVITRRTESFLIDDRKVSTITSGLSEEDTATLRAMQQEYLRLDKERDSATGAAKGRLTRMMNKVKAEGEQFRAEHTHPIVVLDDVPGAGDWVSIDGEQADPERVQEIIAYHAQRRASGLKSWPQRRYHREVWGYAGYDMGADAEQEHADWLQLRKQLVLVGRAMTFGTGSSGWESKSASSDDEKWSVLVQKNADSRNQRKVAVGPKGTLSSDWREDEDTGVIEQAW